MVRLLQGFEGLSLTRLADAKVFAGGHRAPRFRSVSSEFVSNTAMDIPPDIEQRLIDLEIKASFAEDTLDRLNEVIVRQQSQIDRLLHELAALKEYGSASGNVPATRNLRDELPPHF
jgi:SlyX protein